MSGPSFRSVYGLTLSLSGPEQQAADAHQVAAFLKRFGVIAAHAHGEDRHGGSRPYFTLIEQRPEVSELLTDFFLVLREGRHAHEAPDPDVVQVRQFRCSKDPSE